MKNSKSYYNNIASNYNTKTNQRIKYLNTIDAYVLSNSCLKGSYLDIGSGDGRRAIKIFNNLHDFSSLVMVDDSKEMLSYIQLSQGIEIFNKSILDFESNQKFNLITCLWNVLGHFPDKKSRKELFFKINQLLADDGVFIFDVNNRYNVNQYGYENVANNMAKDYCNDKESGWFILGEGAYKTKVYTHSPFDIEDYLLDTGLSVIETKYVDYSSGEYKNSFLEGQLLYKIKKNEK